MFQLVFVFLPPWGCLLPTSEQSAVTGGRTSTASSLPPFLTKDHIAEFSQEHCLFAIMMHSQKIKYTGMTIALKVQAEEL